ncbi:MAG: tRNA (N(6)-L-threonylcarbamoyladenosine(37)-C(2))-methylthiotransferase MtaB [Candidatus Sulfobium sp.]|jgi:threonylcarbamoyladenosine tRNA methylthiotransferase MtaB
MRVSLLTLGCRVNQAESSVLEGTLKENGVNVIDLKDNPDICIVNTCAVTSKSDYNSRQLIRRAARAGAKVIVTGCYSQLRPHEVKAIPGVAGVVGNTNKYEIVSMLTGRPTELSFSLSSRSRPHLKVQDGCNFRCSYCSVPHARGTSRSVPPGIVIERARAIESRGYKEIVLTGIHLGTYGHDLNTKSNLNILLKKLLLGTDTIRFRLSSLEIGEINEELMEIMQSGRICNHLHVPLQSGSDRILRLMDRRYTGEHYRERILLVHEKVDNLSLGTDVIVGFPGEGDEEFSDTHKLISGIPFTYLHIFPYSPRPGTKAAEMRDTSSREAVAKRLAALREMDTLRRDSYKKLQLEGRLEVILEDSRGGNLMCGTSRNYLKVLVAVQGQAKGSLVGVRPTELIDGMLRGNAIS